ncbi:MAG: NAD(P)/FAD-dependent oxidoreductase [Stellaceae bacterium]
MGGRSIAVVGAGVVGMSAALYLHRDGHKVSVIDARAPGTLTSYGNAGGIVTGAVTPTSTPDLWREIPSMLLDPASPVRMRWSYLPRLAPWLVRFLWAGRRAQVDKSAAALAPILAQANAAHRELAALAGVHDVLRPVGWLKVYETETGFHGSALERELMSRHGIKFEVLNSDELRQLEPHLAPKFVKALFQPDSGFASYPWKLVDGYGQYFAQSGGEFLHENVRRLEPREGGGLRVRSERGIRDFDTVVVAAGAWSARLAAGLGDRVSLEAERGYHLNLDPGDAGELRRPVVFPERVFAMAPMEDGIRINSGIELAGLEAPPDFSRIYKLLPHARAALPGLGDRVNREWMGYRPSTPDSVPVIGASPRCPSVVYAFGHGHLGLTLGPATGKLVASVVAGRSGGIDLVPYRPDRF